MNGVRATVVTSFNADVQRVHLVKLKQIALFQRGIQIEAAATMLQKQVATPDSHHVSQRQFYSERITAPKPFVVARHWTAFAKTWVE